MPELLTDYLPLVIFIGVAVFIGQRCWSRRSSSPIQPARSRKAVGL